MAEFVSLGKALERHAVATPDQVALIVAGDQLTQNISLTYGQLHRLACGVSSHLTSLSLRGKRVLICPPAGAHFVAALFGCFYAGAVAVPTFPPGSGRSRADRRLRSIVADCDPDAALTDGLHARRGLVLSQRLPGLERLRWIDIGGIESNEMAWDGDGMPAHSFSASQQPEDLAVLQYTSGSTAKPKGVMLSHANLLANLEFITSRIPGGKDRLLVIWLPPYHDMGLIGGILEPIVHCYPVIVIDPKAFRERPREWVEALSRYGATVTGAPDSAWSTAAHVSTAVNRGDWNLHRLLIGFDGAERVRATTIASVETLFAESGLNPNTLVPCYGLAEATLAVTIGWATEPIKTRSADDGREWVSCGKSAPDHTVAIVSPVTRELQADGVIGEIWVAGPSVAAGYWQKPNETSATFEQSIPGLGGGFLRTGDLGFLHEGELYVTGRWKELVVIGGDNYHPSDIEESAEAAHPAISPHACVAFAYEENDRECSAVCCEVRRSVRRDLNVEECMASVRREVLQETGLMLTRVVLLEPGSLPRTTSGKLKRGECRDLLLAGRLPGILSLKYKPTSSYPGHQLANLPMLVRAVAELKNVNPQRIDAGASLDELGVDSLLRVEFIAKVEANTDLRLPDKMFATHRRLIDIASDLARWQQSSEEQGARTSSSSAAFLHGTVPLSPSQQLFVRQQPALRMANVVVLRMPVNLQYAALERTMELLEEEFDVLRLRLRERAGEWSQEYVEPGSAVRLRRYDVTGASIEVIRAARLRAEAELTQTLNVFRGPIISGAWFDRGSENRGVLLLALHHLFFDGLSVVLIGAAMERIYGALSRGDAHTPSLHRPTFGDWVQALSKKAAAGADPAALDYWRRVGADHVSYDMPEGDKQWKVARGRVLSSAEQIRLETAFPSPGQQYALFLAAIWSGWCKVSNQRDFYVLLQRHGRDLLHDLQPMRAAGWFAGEIPFLLRDGAVSAGEKTSEWRLRETERQLAVFDQHRKGYPLLAELDPDPEVRHFINRLPAPQIAWYDSRHLREVRENGRTFRILKEFTASPRDKPAHLAVVSALESGLSSWRAFYHETALPADFVEEMLEEIKRFVVEQVTRTAETQEP